MKKKELAERIVAIEKHLGIEPNKVELEVGKWYWVERPKDMPFPCKERALINYQGDDSYGFGHHLSWVHIYNSRPDSINGYCFKEANPEEVKSALVEEAKRRGYSNGLMYKCPHNKPQKKPVELQEFENIYCTERGLTDGHGGYIFYNGKWAEIIEQQKQNKHKEIELNEILKGVFVDDYVRFELNGNKHNIAYFKNDQIEKLYTAIQELKGGGNGKD